MRFVDARFWGLATNPRVLGVYLPAVPLQHRYFLNRYNNIMQENNFFHELDAVHARYV